MPPKRTDWRERLERRIAEATRDANGCLIWPGPPQNGYGWFGWYGVDNDGPKRASHAHRVVWILANGDIPPEVHVDHVATRGCKSTLCIELGHLEAVPAAENKRRGQSPMAKNARKTECPRGHPYSGDNLIVEPRTGHRRCRQCRRDEQARRAAR